MATRLVYIINSLHIGGAEIGLCRLLDGLDGDRYRTTVFTIDGYSGEMAAKLPASVDLVDLDLRSGSSPSKLRAFGAATRRADVVVGSLYHSAMLARAVRPVNRGATIAVWCHNEVFKTPARRWLFDRTGWLGDVVLADSEVVSEMLVRDLGVHPDRVRTVPIAGIRLEEYPRVDHADRTPAVVGCVGRLTEQKNQFRILDVAERLDGDRFSFRIAGDGPLRDELTAAARERGLDNVTFEGAVPSVPAFLSELDVYVQPSVHEGLCITVLEAMAAGLPVVGSDVGGIGQNVDHGENGCLCDPADVTAFVDAVRTLGTDVTLRERFGNAGRDLVASSFTQGALVDEFETAIGRKDD